jgi:hypothetical protein
MKLIGWDVGIKNLSYCVIDYDDNDYKICDWGIIDLRTNDQKEKGKKCAKISLKDLSRELYKNLEKNKQFSEFDYVIIENQPVLKNPTMKSVQMILYSYFSFKSLHNKNFKDLLLMSASNKLKVYTEEIVSEEMDKINKLKSKYNRNKKISIMHTKILIKDHTYNSEKWLEFFEGNKKKDDLADSYLMILYYLKKNKLIKI